MFSNNLALEKKLRTAAADGDLKTVKELCNQGVNCGAAGSESNRTALHWAAQRGYGQIVKLLLQHSAKGNLHTKDRLGNTALHCACSSREGILLDRLSIIQLLLAAGLSPLDENNTGTTPLNFMTQMRDDSALAANDQVAEQVKVIIEKMKASIKESALSFKSSVSISENGTVKFFATATSLLNDDDAIKASRSGHCKVEIHGFM